MNFNHIKAALDNNADESPSIYLAIRLMASLVDDFESVPGIKSLADCPLGGDSAPLEMQWLCRQINKIYSEKHGEFEQSYDRLDAAIATMKSYEAELDAAADISEKLLTTQSQIDEMQPSILAAQENKTRYDAANRLLKKAQQELKNLQQFDADDEERSLEKIQEQIASLSNQQGDIRRRIENAATEHNSALKKLSEANAALENVENEANQAKQNIDDTKKRIGDINRELENARIELAAQTVKETELKRELGDLKQQIDDKEQAVNNYESDVLVPLRNQNTSLQEKLDGLESEKSAIVETCAEIERQYNDTVNTIALLREQEPERREELTQKETELEVQKKTSETIKNEIFNAQIELDRLTKELGVLQSEHSRVSSLVSTQEKRVNTETEQYNQNAKKLEDLKAEVLKVQEDTLALEPQIAQAQDRLKEKQDAYSSLTKTFSATNEEIRKLEADLAALNPEDTKHNHTVRKQQIEKDIADIKDLQAQYESMQKDADDAARLLLEAQKKQLRHYNLESTNSGRLLRQNILTSLLRCNHGLN